MEMKFTLKTARQYAGYTQKEVAEKIGVTNDTVCRWEKSGNIRLDQFEKLLELYQVPMEMIKR